MPETEIEYKGHTLKHVGGVWETRIGGLWHKRKTYDAMRDHIDRINAMAADPWPTITFPVTGAAIPSHFHYIATDLMTAVRGQYPSVDYTGERKVSMSLKLEKMPGSDAHLCTMTGMIIT